MTININECSTTNYCKTVKSHSNISPASQYLIIAKSTCYNGWSGVMATSINASFTIAPPRCLIIQLVVVTWNFLLLFPLDREPVVRSAVSESSLCLYWSISPSVIKHSAPSIVTTNRRCGRWTNMRALTRPHTAVHHARSKKAEQ